MEAGRAWFSSHIGPLNADESVSHLENGVHRPCLSNVFTVKKQQCSFPRMLGPSLAGGTHP